MTRTMQCLVLSLLLLAGSDALAVNNRRSAASKPITREELPTLAVPKGEALDAPAEVSKSDFYPATYTLLRAGPVPFLRRLADGRGYDQSVYKYMRDFKKGKDAPSLMTAQGNVDAFLASADDWAEQKVLEKQGRREVYDYGKPLPLERVVLSTIWGSFTILLFSRVLWQLANGNRNLF